MQKTDKTAKEIYFDVKANPARKRFGFGKKAALVNIDLQKAYTRTDLFKTAYENDPDQMEYINQLAEKFRALGWPVVWTNVAYMDTAAAAGVWGTRTDTPDSLQNIKFGSGRSELDDRLKLDRSTDAFYDKKMPSPFLNPFAILIGMASSGYCGFDGRFYIGLRACRRGRFFISRISYHHSRRVCGR